MRDKAKEAKYLRERVVKRKSVRKAAKAAGVSIPTAFRAERDPKIKSAMAAALDKVGATEEKIARTIANALDANKVISANLIAKDGEGMADAHSMTKDFVEVEDHPTRLKASELAGKFRGDFIERVELGDPGEFAGLTERLEAARSRSLEAMRARRGKS